MKLRMTLVCGLLLSSGWALAQDQAQQNLQQQQWQQEQTRRGYQAQQDAYAAQQQIPPPLPQPTGEWITTWGAIAEGAQNGDTGVAVGKRTKKEAEAEAVRQCLNWGGGGCKPLVSYYNQCVVLANGPAGGVGGAFSTGPSVQVASDVALSRCSKKNSGATCQVVYSACSEPIFKRY